MESDNYWNNPRKGQGDGSVGKTLALQAGGLEFEPREPLKKPGAVTHACNLSAEEVETGTSLETRWPTSLDYSSSSRPIRDPVSNKKWEVPEE